MTDFKVGDKVRAIRATKAPYIRIHAKEGDELTFVRDSASAGGEPWICVKHPKAVGGYIYFEAKDFELVPTESRSSTFNKGDRVTCNSSRSYYATDMIEGVYTVAYTTETWRGVPLVALNEGAYMVEPSTLSHVPKAVSVEMAKKPPSKASPPGWTFRAAPSDFDGPRILRELEAQGAQYAVIVWGKGEHDRIAVISQSFDTRADAYADAHQGRPTVLYTSLWPVSSFGPGVETTYGGESDVGWHEVTHMDDSPARLRDLKALAGRVGAWEQANAKVRCWVAYGA